MIREFRALSVADLFDAFLKVFFNKQSMLLVLAYFLSSLVTFIPILFALSQSLFGLIDSLVPTADFNQLGLGDLETLFPTWLVLVCLALNLFVSAMYALVSTDLFGSRFFERPFSPLRSFVFHLRKIPAYFVYLGFSTVQSASIYPVMSIFSFVMIALTIAFPGPYGYIVTIIAYVVIVFAVIEASSVFFKGILPAMAFERLRFFRSIGRSVGLLTRDYVRIFAASLLFRVLIFLGSCIIGFLIVVLSRLVLDSLHLKEERALVVGMLVFFSAFGFMLFITNVAGTAFNTVLYCNQKVKREGLGGELLARRFLEENAEKGAAPSSP